VFGGLGGGGVERQLALGLEVETFLCRLFGRPGIELSPAVDTGLEYGRLAEFVFALVFEEMLKEGELHVFLIMWSRLVAKMDVAEAFPGASIPATVLPRSHDEHIENSRVLCFDGAVSVERAIEVFGIEPAAHRHDGGRHFLQVG